MGNVIKTGVPVSQPCPAEPDDGYDWIPVNFMGEWRLLRGSKKK